MAVPTLVSVLPASGPSSGGDLVRLVGSGFAAAVAVGLGGLPGVVAALREGLGVGFVDLRTPPHEAGFVDVTLENLDADGSPVPGESATLLGAYRYLRPEVAREWNLTRLVRQILREIKRQVIANVSASVAVDYDDTPADGLNVVAIATLPSLVLSGPTLRQNRFFSINVPHEDVVSTPDGPELERRRPPYTVDLVFTLTAASERTAELLNLMAAVATFLNRNRWLELPRDPDDATLGTVRWEMDADGELRAQLQGKDDVRAFTWGLVVRGFDVDEGLPLDRGRPVIDPELQTVLLNGGSP